ncbi:MAG: thioredoxin family protein [Saprospiraceae bacterium]
MKKYILSCLIGFSSIYSFAQEGIKFLEAEFGEVLALAELEGKLVFLDAYTDWCGPCKKMDKEVFSKKEVGDFYNVNFLSVKVNMEKGEGIALAEKHFIFAYPSLLFVNYDGTVAHRYAGFLDQKGILALGGLALDEGSNLEGLSQQYKDGERSADFLLKYLQASFQGGGGNHVKILEDYLATQTDWNTSDNKELIFNLLDHPNSTLFDHLVKNKAAYAETYGASTVTNKIQSLVYESLSKGTTKLADADQLFNRAYPKDAKKLAAHYKMAHYQQREDGKGYAAAAIAYVKNFPDIGLEELNDISWGFYDIVEEKKSLKKALKWAKKSVQKDNSYLNNDTLASLYQKIRKDKKAIKVATKAIAIAKALGEDYSASTALIREIEESRKESK